MYSSTISTVLKVVSIYVLVTPFHCFADNEPDGDGESGILNINTLQCRLKSYELQFDLIRDEYNVGQAERSLKSLNNTGMQLQSNVTASVAFMEFVQKEISELPNYTANGLVPVKYTKQQKKPFKSKTTKSYLIKQDVSSNRSFDPLSVYDHLRELVCSGLKTDITVDVQEQKEKTQYHFLYKGKHTISLPIGDVDTVLMIRTRKTSSRETSIWFDINHNYVPVKIQQVNNGENQAILMATKIFTEK